MAADLTLYPESSEAWLSQTRGGIGEGLPVRRLGLCESVPVVSRVPRERKRSGIPSSASTRLEGLATLIS